MTDIRWRTRHMARNRGCSIAEAGARELSGTEDGALERVEETAENTLRALCRLVEALHNKGVLADDDVRRVLNMHAYEPVENDE